MNAAMPLLVRMIVVCGAMLGANAAEDPTYRSPVALVANRAGTSLYVAEATANRIVEIDPSTGVVRRDISVSDAPSALTLSPDERTLFVAGAVPEGRIHVITTATGTVAASWPAGHTPTDVMVMPDGSRLYVCNRFNNEVEALDAATGAVIAHIPVVREPVAAALTPDGSRLIVANHLPAGRADADTVAAAVSLIDTRTNQVTATIALPNGSTGLRGACVSPDGLFAYVTHVLGRYQQPTTQLERGWMNTNALSVIDLKTSALLATVLLDGVDQGAANPWSVRCTANGAQLCVTHAGSHELSIIDRAAFHRKLATPAAANAADDLSFMAGMQRRLAVTGKGPRGLAIIAERAYLADYFSDNLDVVDLTTGTATALSLGPVAPMTSVRSGELAFNDAARCFQQWQSCASCHPDGRTDGLNWDLMNDGLGNPKNTRNMLNAHRRAPVMALGIRESAEKAVRAGFRYIQFAVVEEAVCATVDDYLKSLTPVPSPHLIAGKLNPRAERGRELFTSVGCSHCHQPPLYTNLKKYDFHFATGIDQGKPFMVPTLLEIWRTAPYLHDGRAATIKDVLIDQDPQSRHSQARDLNPQELDDLIEYVLSL